jgi:hypothetical protein
MSDIRPDFTIARCCRNCHFYRTKAGADTARQLRGVCRLPLIEDKTASPLKTHGTAICNAHVWKSNSKSLHKIVVSIGAAPPEGTH